MYRTFHITFNANSPAEFKSWSAQYIAGLPTRQARAIRYCIAEVRRGHDAHLDSVQRKALWKKVEELRGPICRYTAIGFGGRPPKRAAFTRHGISSDRWWSGEHIENNDSDV